MRDEAAMSTTAQEKDLCEEKGEGGRERTYAFNADGGASFFDDETKSRIWQIAPCLCGCLFCLVFGLTLGWPSPIYPKLLPETSPLPITLDQSAMIAGVLLAGYILGVPLSNFSPFGPKYGILMVLLCMTGAWVIMWQARTIYFLLGSRGLVGLSNGYGLGQIKQYIKEMCEPKVARNMASSINLFFAAGILTAVVLGPRVDFRLFSIIATCLSIVCFFACVFLPHTPAELVRFGKIEQARRLLTYLKPTANTDIETQKIKMSLEDGPDHWSFCQVVKTQPFGKNFSLLVVLIFFQQFSGPPSTIVYCQIMFAEFGTPCPDVFAVAYIAIFFLSNTLGYYHLNGYSKRNRLLFSSTTVSVLLIINSVIMFHDYNRQWCYSSAVVMCLFIFFHTIGLGCVPFNITDKLFPKPALKVVAQAQVMLYSFFAIVVTKVFQVLMKYCPFYVPFFVFTFTAVTSIAFILIFIPRTFSVSQVDTQEKSNLV